MLRAGGAARRVAVEIGAVSLAWVAVEVFGPAGGVTCWLDEGATCLVWFVVVAVLVIILGVVVALLMILREPLPRYLK